jgi:hypothetical protein
MDIVGVIAAALSVVGAIVAGIMTTWSAQRSRKLEHALELQRRTESKAEQTEEILSRYREPLLLAAHSLQGRLYNAIATDYLTQYLHCGDEEQERYARDFTVYVLGEYLCWVEIIRRELRMLDLGDEQRNRDFQSALEAIHRAISTQSVPQAHLRLFRGQQRALGELMMVVVDQGRADCMTYPAFCARLDNDAEFAWWFHRLRSDIDAVAAHDRVGNARLANIQRALIDLIDFLDPDRVRLATPHRERVPVVEPQPRAAANAG